MGLWVVKAKARVDENLRRVGSDVRGNVVSW